MKEATTTNEPTALPGTPAEREALRKLAEQVVVDRLSRAFCVGHTSSGRVVAELRGEPTPAEVTWNQLMETSS